MPSKCIVSSCGTLNTNTIITGDNYFCSLYSLSVTSGCGTLKFTVRGEYNYILQF